MFEREGEAGVSAEQAGKKRERFIEKSRHG